ncbi:MAG TPA: hypothetical protein VN857_06875 [Chthoniobacterales bacterium]|jgi:hypothetical protein|nr:hypothetical protein [Chthoniobacterales bacterium]
MWFLPLLIIVVTLTAAIPMSKNVARIMTTRMPNPNRKPAPTTSLREDL